MKKMSRLGSFFSLFLLTTWLTACVTINIYFPAAAAEDAARTIVRDVLNVPEGDASGDSSQEPQNDSDAGTTEFGHVLYGVLNILIAPAHAEANININTPAIGQLRASLKQRSPALAAYYRSGAIGLTSNALVAVRDLSAVSLKDRNKVKKLVADDNDDRQALYREIARANDHPEWEADIQSTFARVWVEEAQKGTWYQSGSGWKQK